MTDDSQQNISDCLHRNTIREISISPIALISIWVHRSAVFPLSFDLSLAICSRIYGRDQKYVPSSFAHFDCGNRFAFVYCTAIMNCEVSVVRKFGLLNNRELS